MINNNKKHLESTDIKKVISPHFVTYTCRNTRLLCNQVIDCFIIKAPRSLTFWKIIILSYIILLLFLYGAC